MDSAAMLSEKGGKGGRRGGAGRHKGDMRLTSCSWHRGRGPSVKKGWARAACAEMRCEVS